MSTATGPAAGRSFGCVLTLLLLGVEATSWQILGTNWTSDDISNYVPISPFELGGEVDSGGENATSCEVNQCHARGLGFTDHHDVSAYGCFCDKDCAAFGDCCRDAPWSAAASTEATCSFLPDYGSHLYLVSQCPTSWPHDAIRLACQSQNVSLAEDPLLALPVTSPRSGQTYRNVACARCHQDTAGVVFWNTRVSCRWVIQGEDNVTAATLRQNEHGQWGVLAVADDGERFEPCGLELRLPRRLQDEHLRECLPSVSECAPSWTDRETAAECAAYTARVRDKSGMNDRAVEYGHVYRNLHCALCNGVPLDVLVCGGLDRNSRGGGGLVYDDEELIAYLHGHQFAYPASPPPFSMLLDISDHSGSDTVGVIQICDGERLWDPFFHKCRDVFCDAGQFLENDVCVSEMGTSSGNGSAEHSQFRLCPKFYLSADEFETRSNGSVYVKLYDRLYVDGEFELRDGELAVCSQSSDFSKFDDTLGILSLVFVVASVICLCCHLVLFCLVSEQRNLPGKNLASLCVCLVLGYICFIAAPFQDPGTAGCRVLGIVMYAAFIASFLWMNVMAFDVFISLRYV